MGFTRFYRVFLGLTGFNWVFNRVLGGFIGFSYVLRVSMGFYWVLLGFSGNRYGYLTALLFLFVYW